MLFLSASVVTQINCTIGAEGIGSLECQMLILADVEGQGIISNAT